MVSLRSAVAWLLSDRPESIQMPDGTTIESEIAKERQKLAERIQAEIEAEDERLAHELGLIKTRAHTEGLRVVQDHLEKFLASNASTATYEAWIFSLHPENTNTSKLPDQEVREIAASAVPHDRRMVDHRFYLPDADHLNLWNNHPQTELRRVRSSVDSNKIIEVGAAHKTPEGLQLEYEKASAKSAILAVPSASPPALPHFSNNYV